MAKNIGQAARLLSQVGFNVQFINKPNNMIYNILHKARPIIILPIQAIENNVVFMCDTSKRFIKTTDGKIMEVVKSSMINIIDGKDEIEDVYGVSWHLFAEKWNIALHGLHVLDFIRLELKEKEMSDGME